MHLSARLLKLAAKVPDDAVVADIGTDHALLPIYLVSSGRCPRAIAVEVADGPYQRAKEAIESFGLSHAIDLRLGDGLTVIRPGEVDVVVMAGMGGSQMIAIMEKSPRVRASVRRWILQPMRGAAEVRRYLYSQGLWICDEELARESRHIYEIIVAEPGHEPIADDIVFEVGPRLIERRDPLLQEVIAERINIYRRILVQVESGSTSRALSALQEFQDKIRRLGRLAEQLQQPAQGGRSDESSI